jgi:hypothetical protein
MHCARPRRSVTRIRQRKPMRLLSLAVLQPDQVTDSLINSPSLEIRCVMADAVRLAPAPRCNQTPRKGV